MPCLAYICEEQLFLTEKLRQQFSSPYILCENGKHQALCGRAGELHVPPDARACRRSGYAGAPCEAERERLRDRTGQS